MIKALLECCDERPLTVSECGFSHASKINHLFLCIVSVTKTSWDSLYRQKEDTCLMPVSVWLSVYWGATGKLCGHIFSVSNGLNCTAGHTQTYGLEMTFFLWAAETSELFFSADSGPLVIFGERFSQLRSFIFKLTVHHNSKSLIFPCSVIFAQQPMTVLRFFLFFLLQ